VQILNASNLNPDFQEGDVGIILKKNGDDFQLFNMHKDLDPNAMTPEQLKQGEILVALAVVLQTPKLLDMVLDFAKQAQAGGELINVVRH
jgi:hypothetical protein